VTSAPAGATISVRGLARRYGDVEAVRGIDFDAAPGETFGFPGPNGAGKSTTISISARSSARLRARRPWPASTS
jgi:ABC-2 type transport system ATP-binding protein